MAGEEETDTSSPYFQLANGPIYREMLVVSSSEPQRQLKHMPIGEDDVQVNHPENQMITLTIEPDFGGFRGWISYSTMLICNAVLCSILFGYSLSVLNSCMNSIALHFQWCGNGWDSTCGISQFYQAVINAILFLGAVAGSIISGRLVPLGRRWSLQLACWIFILGGLIGASALGSYSWIQLIAARILVGIGLGIVTVVTPIYISESTPAASRGFFGTMHQTMIGVGIFIGISLGLPLSPNSSNDPSYVLTSFDHWWWRFMLIFQCLPSALCLIGFAFVCVDETPHYLIDNEKTVEAAKTIMHIHGAANVNEIEGTMLEITQAVYEARGLTQITLKEAIKEKYYRFGLLVGFFLACIQQLSGINVIISSSDSLFAMAGLSPNTVTMTSTVMAFVNALASAAAALFVENWGRRPLLLWGIAGQVLFMVPIGILRFMNEQYPSVLPDAFILSPVESTWFSVVGTIGFVLSFSFALGPIVWIYVSEIFPVEIRGAALGACGACNWISAFFMVFIGRFLHVTTAFLVFGIICFIGLICTYLWVIETKGSSIENSPVSPQSLRLSSRLIQNSRGDTQDVTLDDIREKIRSASPYSGQHFGSSNSLHSVGGRRLPGSASSGSNSNNDGGQRSTTIANAAGMMLDGNFSSMGVDRWDGINDDVEMMHDGIGVDVVSDDVQMNVEEDYNNNNNNNIARTTSSTRSSAQEGASSSISASPPANHQKPNRGTVPNNANKSKSKKASSSSKKNKGGFGAVFAAPS